MQIKKIKFHQHCSIHECDDCGMNMSDIYTVSCKGFKFTHGEPAYCYGTEEGDIEVVLKELFQYLQSVGHDVTIPTYYEDDYDAHVEENTYYNQFVYGNGFITYIHENGIEVKTKYTSDDYDDDNSMEIVD
ncbi:hypothetical protein BvCmsB5655_03195 [Escherichia coli]|uniref:hypothetical protein n=1 Tax=Escherichia coli TaxID=562 RepID=UPI0010B44096|nr:hypothetical protein [Escherichia coli]GCJ79971.1 hypothetical protein BvCmsB5655_03195 [Escherichia coli]